MSVLEKLIMKCGPDSQIPFVMAFDMVGAGVDSTGNTLGFALYNLAAHPDKQETLREEILSHDENITEKTLNSLRYLKAFLKESSRVYPLAIGGGRTVEKGFILNGYQIPDGTQLSWFATLLGNNPKYIKSPEQ